REPPTVGGSASRGPTNQESSVGVAHLGSSPTLTASKGGSSFHSPEDSSRAECHHVVTTSFGLTPLHPACPLACNERLRRDERYGVGWRVSSFRYESAGRVFVNTWVNLKIRKITF